VKNIVKTILLSLILIVLSGCTVRYGISITDIEISEFATISNPSVIVDRDSKMINTFNKDYGKYYDIFLNDDELIDCYDSGAEDCSYYEKKAPFTVDAFAQLNSITDLRSSKLLEDYFGVVNVNEGKTVSLKIKPNHKLGMIFNGINLSSAFIDDLEFTIFTSYRVISNNADSVDGNLYTWKFDKDNYSKKTVELEYSTSGESDINNGVNNGGSNDSINLDNIDEVSNNVSYIFLILLGIVVLVVIIAMYNKYRKSNLV